MTISIGYDRIPCKEIKDLEKNTYIYTGRSVAPGPCRTSYYHDAFTDMFYPLNGAHISSYSHYKMNYTIGQQNIEKQEICLTQPDFHCSLPALFKKNNLNFETDSISNLMCQNKKFIYSFSLRYFFFEFQGLNINTKLLKHPLGKKNFLCELLNREIVEEYQKGNVLLLFNDVIEGTLYTKELLATLVIFLKEIGIENFNNIVIVTSNSKCTVHNNKPFNIVYWQYFETATQLLFEKAAINIDYSKKIETITNHRGYRFLYLNNKPRPHRFYLCYKLWKNNASFKSDFCVSCRHRGESCDEIYSDFYMKNHSYIKRLGSCNFFKGLQTISKKEFSEFYSALPFSCEFDKFTPKEKYYNYWDIINDTMYNHTCIQVVTETLVEHIVDCPDSVLFLTEKVFKPIASKSPFILYGPYKVIEHLHNQGYKTFHEFWDESYDDIADPIKRADSIACTIKNMANYSQNDFVDLLKKIQPIVEYNYNHFRTRNPERDLITRIKKFYEHI